MEKTDKERIIGEIKNKKSNYYFYCPPTQGKPSGAISYTYDLVDILRKNGFNAHILHDEEYNVPMWMGENYHNLPHVTFSKVSKIKASDFLFLPEIYVQSFFKDMEKNNVKLPCEVVVVSQIQDFILHSLDIPNQWGQWGIKNAITTTNNQKDYIQQLMRSIDVDVINPYIHDDFKAFDKPQKPVVLINTRDPKKAEKVVNEFNKMHPHYSWITFNYMAGMSRKDFAKEMREACLAVWIDDISSFGTFPLECMKSNVPVIGKIPEMMPEWMGEEQDGKYNIKDNGTWLISSHQKISEYIGYFFDKWLLDEMPEGLEEKMQETADQYTKDNTEKQTLDVFNGLMEKRIQRIERIFEKQQERKSKLVVEK